MPPAAGDRRGHLEAGVQRTVIEDIFVKNARLILFEIFLSMRIDRQWPWSIIVIHLKCSHRDRCQRSRGRTLEAKIDGGGEGG